MTESNYTLNAQTFTPSTQESIVTVLGFCTDDNSKWISQEVKAEWFDDPYREIVRRSLPFWEQYGTAPGSEHIDDLFGEILGISPQDLLIQVAATLAVGIVALVFARPFLLLCFDPDQAQVAGFSARRYGNLMLLLVAIMWHLLIDRDKPGKAEALQRLRTRYRWLFFGGVMGAGTLVPALLADISIAARETRTAIGVVCFILTLAGGFYLRLLTLRVGYFTPVSGALRLSKRE